MQDAVNIIFGGEELIVNADRTLWWPKKRVLFATDLHAGKTEHMRRFGVAIPAGTLTDDLQRLTAAAERYRPDVLIFLGDLFHSDSNNEWLLFANWCKKQSYTIELVRGNHDRFLSDEQLILAGIAVHPEPYYLAPFELRHHPLKKPSDVPVLTGHVHPVITLQGPAKETWRLPCFLVQAHQLILPAFGAFTGGFVVNNYQRDAAYACSPDFSTIIRVPHSYGRGDGV